MSTTGKIPLWQTAKDTRSCSHEMYKATQHQPKLSMAKAEKQNALLSISSNNHVFFVFLFIYFFGRDQMTDPSDFFHISKFLAQMFSCYFNLHLPLTVEGKLFST